MMEALGGARENKSVQRGGGEIIMKSRLSNVNTNSCRLKSLR